MVMVMAVVMAMIQPLVMMIDGDCGDGANFTLWRSAALPGAG